jgi:hypothetical protein
MEGVIILHKMIHKMHRKKQSDVILKLDFKKLTIRLIGHLCNKSYV